ncbi:MAG: type II toxin-antitoxin system PemK/MazF family toxin [Cyanobacteria bacterium RU_5_0]|nr:type II toxin-antitoxin system PemK/MazF family toxin [Cyanobacteria bacterium RU_5_0]
MRRGEIWLADLQPTIGAEISKTRPVVIVSRDSIGILPLKVIVPITDWKIQYQTRVWMVRLVPNSVIDLSKTSVADTFQVRSISATRLIRQLGKLTDLEMQVISEALALVLI